MFAWLKYYLLDNVQLARHALGKYIIAFACLMHIGWAIVLMIDIRGGNATPLAVLFVLLAGSKTAVISALIGTAAMAGGFLDMRLRQKLSSQSLTLLLIPQQFLLWCSAGAGMHAIAIQQYADGVHRSWAHITCDQLPIIIMAFLYSAAVIESRYPPRYNGRPK